MRVLDQIISLFRINKRFSIKRLLFYHIQVYISIIGSYNLKEGGHQRRSMLYFQGLLQIRG